MTQFSSASLVCASNRFIKQINCLRKEPEDETTQVVLSTAVRYVVVLMVAVVLSVVSAHKASATQPYALQYSQVTSFDRSRTADGHTHYHVVFKFYTGGYAVNFPPSVTRLYDRNNNFTNDFVINVSATGPSPGEIVTQQITTQEAWYDLGLLTTGQTYTFRVNQTLNPTTLAGESWTRSA